MEHTFFCEQCGKRFDVDEALIGKRARCKDCQHVFVIPGHTSPPAPFDPYRREEPTYQNAYALEDLEVHPPRLGKPTAEVGKKRRRSSGDESYRWVGSLTLCLAIAAGVFLVILLLAWVGDSEAFGWIGLGGLGGASVGMVGLGSILLLVTPFRESFLAGLLFLFMPFYPWYYIITRWEAVKRSAVLIFTGAAFCLITQVSGYAWLSVRNPQLLQQIVDNANGKANPAVNPLPEPIEGALAAGPAIGPGIPLLNPQRGAGPGPQPPANVEQATQDEAARNLPPRPAPGPLPAVRDRARAPGQAQAPSPPPVPAAPRFRRPPRNPGPIAQNPPPRPGPLPPARGGARNRPQGDDRAAQTLDDPARAAEFLGTPESDRAIAALQGMGPEAEPVVIPYLRSNNWSARRHACQVLKVIGTEKSVSELQVIAGNHGPSAGVAREALLAIARRRGSPELQTAEPN